MLVVQIRSPAITMHRWWLILYVWLKSCLQPVLLPFSPNGKAQHIKGFLNRFAKTAKKTSEFLNRVAKLNIPMVGVDPALAFFAIAMNTNWRSGNSG